MVYPNVTCSAPPTGLPEAGMGMTRELDSRTSDGIHVRLLWHRHDARVAVAVHDTKTGDAFELLSARRQPSARRLPPPLRLRGRRAPVVPSGPPAALACPSRRTGSVALIAKAADDRWARSDVQ